MLILSLSAITENKTKITTITAEIKNLENEATTAAVTIFAYDEEGVVSEEAEVTVNNITIEEGAIEIEVNALDEALASGHYVAVVTVVEGEVKAEASVDFTLDFEEVNLAVKTVNDATNQIQLWDALQNELFEGVALQDNIVVYNPMVNENYDTVSEVINRVAEINEAEADINAFNAVKKALNEAYPNQLVIISVLNENFDAVNADYIENYIEAIFAGEAVALTSMTEIQDAIYYVNADLAVEALFDGLELAGGITQADIDIAKALVDALPENVDATTIQAKIDTAQDLFDAANTLEIAIDAIEALFVDIEANELELAIGINQGAIDKAQELLDAYKGNEDTTELQDLIDSAQGIFNSYVANAEDFATMDFSNVKGYTVGFNFGEHTAADVKSVVVKLYKDNDLLATNTSNELLEKNPAATKQSAPFDVLGSFDYVEDANWTYSGWLGALTDIPTKAIIIVTYNNDIVANAENETLTGEDLFASYAINEEDFTTMELSGVKGYTVGFNFGEKTAADVESVVVNLYKGTTLLASNTSNKLLEKDPAATKQSAPFDVFGTFDYAEDGNWTYSGWQGALTDIPTKAEIIVTYPEGIVVDAVNNNFTGDKSIFYVEAVNQTVSSEEMKTALIAFAINEELSEYINLSSQGKLEVAELVLSFRADEEDERYANNIVLSDNLSTAISDRENFIIDVNNAKDIIEMKAVLNNYVFPEFQALNAVEQVEAAEQVLNALKAFEGEEAFKSISEIKTAAGQ